MKIFGLQKMTLLDYPGRVACTVFLGGCDFRCPFCHNFELVDGTAKPLMTDEELISFLEKRRGLLDGVAFTGGEPLLSKELPELMRTIRSLGFKIKLDTNGYHPARLRSMLEDGLVDYVAMDVKNSPEKYAETCGVESVDMGTIRESIDVIMRLAPDYEFRTTVVDELHEVSDFEKIGALIPGAKRYFLQAFTDRDTVPFEGFHAPSKEKLDSYLAAVSPFVPSAELRGV
ncbi:MAG: anaerobic ribonucleoside-triphosphate reductase activating protein [Oscillospiraceae bacterium]|nr:anaerobic ribonucleoside-triphosphate reductase activating protein [Oscillospiraceae bacterium]MBQ2329501.1 anaerobic ribonucleoside-triphosphate reductase activating protein [Oscillospiraceae bacterium]MBQ3985410.1 anaerobic ribonucleoside-triphosphate reductase activating protein [Oscillospiraceae bacterium]